MNYKCKKCGAEIGSEGYCPKCSLKLEAQLMVAMNSSKKFERRVDAVRALDPEGGWPRGCPDCEELREELARLGHPCAPGEPLVEKVRNLAAIIQSQRELLAGKPRRKGPKGGIQCWGI